MVQGLEGTVPKEDTSVYVVLTNGYSPYLGPASEKEQA